MKSVLQALKETNPELFHDCPYEGVLGFSKFRIPQAIVSLLPTGLFRSITTMISTLGNVTETLDMEFF